MQQRDGHVSETELRKALSDSCRNRFEMLRSLCCLAGGALSGCSTDVCCPRAQPAKSLSPGWKHEQLLQLPWDSDRPPEKGLNTECLFEEFIKPDAK